MSMELEEQYDRIYQYCYYRVHNVQTAEDITQEVFLRYLESEGVRYGRPIAYLYTIARNLCIDEYRKKKTEELPDVLPENGKGENAEEELVDAMMLRQAMSALDEYEREIVVLRYVNEVAVTDIAAVYGISRFAMHRKLKKTLKKLERSLSDEKGAAK